MADFPLVGLRTLATLTGLDRDSIRNAIARAALAPAGKVGGHPAYELQDALRALFARRGDIDPTLLSPVERRALADAHLRELELAKRRGEVVARLDVQQAAARAFATCAQTLRAIPDNIERRLGLSPDICEEIEKLIDEAMSDLADQLEETHRAAERLAATTA